MTTQNTRARIARSMALVIIGVALLATSVLAFWMLLLAVPLLAALWLVRNVLDGAAQNTPPRIARIIALVIIGVTLLAAGVSSVMTLWTSSFARFMYFEDLGLDAAAITRFTPVDRGLLVCGGIQALLGAAALIAAAVLAHRRGRAGR
jgi:hypothetical protein